MSDLAVLHEVAGRASKIATRYHEAHSDGDADSAGAPRTPAAEVAWAAFHVSEAATNLRMAAMIAPTGTTTLTRAAASTLGRLVGELERRESAGRLMRAAERIEAEEVTGGA